MSWADDGDGGGELLGGDDPALQAVIYASLRESAAASAASASSADDGASSSASAAAAAAVDDSDTEDVEPPPVPTVASAAASGSGSSSSTATAAACAAGGGSRAARSRPAAAVVDDNNEGSPENPFGCEHSDDDGGEGAAAASSSAAAAGKRRKPAARADAQPTLFDRILDLPLDLAFECLNALSLPELRRLGEVSRELLTFSRMMIDERPGVMACDAALGPVARVRILRWMVDTAQEGDVIRVHPAPRPPGRLPPPREHDLVGAAWTAMRSTSYDLTATRRPLELNTRDMTIRGEGEGVVFYRHGGDDHFALEVRADGVRLENIATRSQRYSRLALCVRNGARGVEAVGCDLQGQVLVAADAQLTLRDSSIRHSDGVGLSVQGGAEALRCRVEDNRNSGISVLLGAELSAVGCKLRRNAVGIYVRGRATLRRTAITDNRGAGVVAEGRRKAVEVADEKGARQGYVVVDDLVKNADPNVVEAELQGTFCSRNARQNVRALMLGPQWQVAAGGKIKAACPHAVGELNPAAESAAAVAAAEAEEAEEEDEEPGSSLDTTAAVLSHSDGGGSTGWGPSSSPGESPVRR